MAKLRLKPEVTQAQKIRELMERFALPPVDYSQGYQTKPVVRLKGKVMGASSRSRPTDTEISKSITELLHRMFFKS